LSGGDLKLISRQTAAHTPKLANGASLPRQLSALVWNPGERVEGYTNFLMTVIMALATSLLDQKQAILAIQVFGILCLLSSGWLTMQITKSLSLNRPPRQQYLVRVLSLGLLYAYYPLAYWTLMGMETGLLTVLLLWATLSALQYEVDLRLTHLWGMSIALGLAYLTRPDSALVALWIILYVLWGHRISPLKQKTWRGPLLALGIYGLFIAER
jgi:arabinofuranosyltransferase